MTRGARHSVRLVGDLTPPLASAVRAAVHAAERSLEHGMLHGWAGVNRMERAGAKCVVCGWSEKGGWDREGSRGRV